MKTKTFFKATQTSNLVPTIWDLKSGKNIGKKIHEVNLKNEELSQQETFLSADTKKKKYKLSEG